jgi:protein involved in polysaccharide export with SLBB domain
MSFQKPLHIITMLLLCVFCCRTPTAAQQSPPAPENNQRDEEDLIHFGDLIDVDVLGSLEYDWRGRLSPEGFLDGIEYAEPSVFGLCRSEESVAADVAKSYEKLLRDPKVVVKIIDRSNRAVSLLEGAVKKPQRFQIKRAVRLNELIILSGGLTEQASGEIRLFRPRNLSCAAQNGESNNNAQVPSEKFVTASHTEGAQIISLAVSDVLSGDIVTVLEAAPIYITGGVNSPKRISSRTQTTLSRAVDSAGGLSKNAAENAVTIFRRVGRETKIIEADLTKIKSSEAEDVPLQPYDVVDVAQKGSPKKKYPPVVQTFETSENKNGVLPLRVIE